MKPEQEPAPPWTTPVIGFRSARPIIGFWHIGAIGDWSRIVGEQYASLRASGLYAASEKIVVGFIGGRGRESELAARVPLPEDPKFDVFVTDNIEDYEFPTLARVWQEAQDNDRSFLFYYLHTKGASLAATSRRDAVNAWRKYMEHFNLEKWEACVAILNDYDTCGVELQSSASQNIDSHYSGNFWWATSDYIKKLPDGHQYWEQHRTDRSAAEFYLCLAHPKAHCFHDFVENLYDHEVALPGYRK